MQPRMFPRSCHACGHALAVLDTHSADTEPLRSARGTGRGDRGFFAGDTSAQIFVVKFWLCRFQTPKNTHPTAINTTTPTAPSVINHSTSIPSIHVLDTPRTHFPPQRITPTYPPRKVRPRPLHASPARYFSYAVAISPQNSTGHSSLTSSPKYPGPSTVTVPPLSHAVASLPILNTRIRQFIKTHASMNINPAGRITNRPNRNVAAPKTHPHAFFILPSRPFF